MRHQPEFCHYFKGHYTRTPSGDKIRALSASTVASPRDADADFEAQLHEILANLQQLSAKTPTPRSEFAKLFKSISPELISWLEKADIVKASEFAATPVRSVKDLPIASVNTGCLVVDGVNLVGAMSKMFGRKPPTPYLPQWHRVFEYVREKFPAKEWKAFYFMTVDPHSHSEGLEKLRGYLEAAHFQVISTPIPAPDVMVNHDDLLAQRAKINEGYVCEMLSQVLSSNSGHVAVVSQSRAMAEPLAKLLTNRKDAEVAVLGFPEFMDRDILGLRMNGLRVIDIDRDISGSFSKRLPRRDFNSPASFDAKAIYERPSRVPKPQ